MAHILPVAVLACLFVHVAPLALAQTTSVEDLFPSTIGEFTADEYFVEEQMPLYGNPFLSGAPTLRKGAAYRSQTGGEVLVSLIIVNERYPGVLGHEDEQAALGLVSFREAALEPNDGWYEASVEPNMDEMIIGRAIVARPLTAHAVLTAETYAPESVSTNELRALLARLDLDAIADHARANSGVNAAVWDFLGVMPRTLADRSLAGFHIESDGQRQPIVSVNALYGDSEEPEFAVVAVGAGPQITDIADILPFRPSSDLTETTLGDWRVLDGVIDGIGGHVVLGDLAVVALFHLSETSTPEYRADLVSDLDVQGIFEAAAAYRASAPSAASAPAVTESSEMRLVSWAHVVEADLIRAILEIEENRIVFKAGHPQLDTFDLMDILLSHHEEQPFLRRIVSIEAQDGTVVIETRPASLEEAVAPR